VFQEVGEALKNKIGSTVKREDLWVTSKLWNVCHKEADVVPALQQTLKVACGPCALLLMRELRVKPSYPDSQPLPRTWG
jgi:diketogulonate reductase-like aldo/keto reductase